MTKPWSCKFDLWVNYTRGLKFTITFTKRHFYNWTKQNIKTICWMSKEGKETNRMSQTPSKWNLKIAS